MASVINTDSLADEKVLSLVTQFQDACFKAALADVQHCGDDACTPITTLSAEEMVGYD